MLNLSEFGILISAIGGVIIIYEKIFEKQDKYIVKFGHYHTEMDDRDAMFIVSRSFKPISIRDYGFIKNIGKLESIHWIAECASESDDYDIEQVGIAEHMEFNQRVEIKCRTGENVIGAFAIGGTQNFPRLSFDRNVSWIRRLFLHLKFYGGCFSTNKNRNCP